MCHPHRVSVTSRSWREAKRVGTRDDHSVPFYRLFVFTDAALMVLGALGRLPTVPHCRSYLAVVSAVPSNMITKILLYFYTTL
jgi:hypothetical protein